ncbi:RDD family protein [Streptomyces sp. NPDC051569]|uniref:RDD family protein n=1 Tax=Streptomyces sp. NPDC051569 TaxID=3365661 RepID=UPI0037AAE6FE
MSNDSPPPGQPPEDDPFLKKPQEPPPQEPPPSDGPSHDSPYGSPYGSGGPSGPPPYDPGGFGGGPYGGTDPYAGMPPLAPFGTRLLARVIDALIIFIPLALISLLAGGLHATRSGTGEWDNFTNQVNTGTQWIWSVIAIVAYVGYDTLMTKKYGRTLGKRWLKLRVGMLNDGAVPPTGPSLTRALVLWLPALICCFCLWWLLIIVTILASKPYKQGLHDKAARTVVVSAAR